MSDDAIGGGCLCDAVRFEVRPPTLWCAHCHCTLCRRAHGAGFVTWFGAATDRAVIVDPDERLAWYRSSADSERGFCSRCGSTLFFRSERWPGELHIVLANVQGSIDRPPDAHVHWPDRVAWCAIDDALEKRGDGDG